MRQLWSWLVRRRRYRKCIRLDCSAHQAGSTPLCVEHLKEQEKAAGYIEPELEAKAHAAGDAVDRE